MKMTMILHIDNNNLRLPIPNSKFQNVYHTWTIMSKLQENDTLHVNETHNTKDSFGLVLILCSCVPLLETTCHVRPLFRGRNCLRRQVLLYVLITRIAITKIL